METRLDCAIKASNELVTTLHRDGLDHGCITTFNDTLTVRQNFTTDEGRLHRSLNSLRHTAAGETRLYDSIYDVVVGLFRRTADRTRPWILVVVTDGDDNCSARSARQCGEEIYRLYTREESNFLFVVGVGDGVNSTRMEQMADVGRFDYIHVKDFLLLEVALITLAHKVTTSLSLSVNALSVGNVSASWAEIQQHRKLSNVAIDYALLIDMSTSMNEISSRAQCFEGHELRKYRLGEWICDVCGKNGPTTMSDYHCAKCDFNACHSHCVSGRPCKPNNTCPNNHPMRYVNKKDPWRCDEDKKLYRGKRLRCERCDYDICPNCLIEAERAERALTYLMANLLLRE